MTMRKINKNQEPIEWYNYRRTPGVQYQSIPELKQALLEEQGYICAYCMCRIPSKNGLEKCRIEHLLCREKHSDRQLDYSNMVLCCSGDFDAINNSESSRKNYNHSNDHCDRSKANNDVSFDIFSDSFIDTLSYSSKDGTIKSSNSLYDREINKLLNLNHALLKENRRATLMGVLEMLKRKGFSSSRIKKTL